MSAVKVAQQRFERLGVPHARPDDYFAEMLKSDKHMTKVKRRMIQEATDIDAAEERRKQSANKKFGKQVQREVLHQRVQKRQREIAEVTELRKKRKGSQADDFGVDVGEERSGKGGGGGKGGGKGSDDRSAAAEARAQFLVTVEEAAGVFLLAGEVDAHSYLRVVS